MAGYKECEQFNNEKRFAYVKVMIYQRPFDIRLLSPALSYVYRRGFQGAAILSAPLLQSFIINKSADVTVPLTILVEFYLSLPIMLFIFQN